MRRPPASTVSGSGRRGAGLGGVRRELLLELRDVGIEVGIRHRGVGDHAEQRADRHGLAFADHDPAQPPRDRALEDVRDLRGLDVEDLVARRDLGALLDQPLRDHALLHRQAPLGHHDRPDRFAHRTPPPTSRNGGRAEPRPELPRFDPFQLAMVLRTAASILSGLGM